jgi:enamine deaminase RidA (YjgF/YER057c/UK114 family)
MVEMAIQHFSSGAPMEETVGYSRMIKAGNLVMIGGTTSVQPDGSVYGEGNIYTQAKYIFEKQIKLLAKAGAKVSDVVKIQVFMRHMSDIHEFNRAYSEFFKPYKPLCTVVGTSELNRPAQLCEIEIIALTE